MLSLIFVGVLSLFFRLSPTKSPLKTLSFLKSFRQITIKQHFCRKQHSFIPTKQPLLFRQKLNISYFCRKNYRYLREFSPAATKIAHFFHNRYSLIIFSTALVFSCFSFVSIVKIKLRPKNILFSANRFSFPTALLT